MRFTRRRFDQDCDIIMMTMTMTMTMTTIRVTAEIRIIELHTLQLSAAAAVGSHVPYKDFKDFFAR